MGALNSSHTRALHDQAVYRWREARLDNPGNEGGGPCRVGAIGWYGSRPWGQALLPQAGIRAGGALHGQMAHRRRQAAAEPGQQTNQAMTSMMMTEEEEEEEDDDASRIMHHEQVYF